MVADRAVVMFNGPRGLGLHREKWDLLCHRAILQGWEIHGWVTWLTSVVVHDGQGPGNYHLRQAARHGVPVISREEFAAMLRNRSRRVPASGGTG